MRPFLGVAGLRMEISIGDLFLVLILSIIPSPCSKGLFTVLSLWGFFVFLVGYWVYLDVKGHYQFDSLTITWSILIAGFSGSQFVKLIKTVILWLCPGWQGAGGDGPERPFLQFC